ncbi:uncharacterized protein LAJ45_03000 [Morchella importuna]|uniref:Rhodopsin domain-containing protein n=1 Tax=Morchella conica CCBAS932 TaxID=1392247 RepID=A0A3N4K7T9_9PEZI|nr:uncharacterized protein LAJ45_03000 [Morchella importuna]KAH8152775.1 hypothetical protein LAJ45_03000 [Morchella importuna]RPB06596.1 hypothetical protein P167DRAFT_540697 [Morchella conica CCBAS932]
MDVFGVGEINQQASTFQTDVHIHRMSAYVVESWTLFSVGAVVIFMRLVARLKMVGFAGLKPDDYLMFIGLIVYAVESTMAHLVGIAGGSNFGLTEVEREALTPHQVQMRVMGTKAFMVGWFTYTGLIYILKLCMVFFFKRVTFGLDRQGLIRSCFVSVGVTWIVIILTLFLTCRPWYKSFQVVPDPGLMCQIENPVYYLVVLILNLFTDGLIISVPLPLLLRTRMPIQRKMFLVIMFSAGIFVMIAAVLRCGFSLTDSKNSSTAAIWACRETFVAVLVGNGPMIRPIFSQRFWNGRPSTFENSHSSGASNPRSIELANRKLRMGSTTLNTSDSMEHIVDPEPALMIKTEVSYEVSSQEAGSFERGIGSPGLGGRNGAGNLYNGYSATVSGNV